jgi:hypothetical protein
MSRYRYLWSVLRIRPLLDQIWPLRNDWIWLCKKPIISVGDAGWLSLLTCTFQRISKSYWHGTDTGTMVGGQGGRRQQVQSLDVMDWKYIGSNVTVWVGQNWNNNTWDQLSQLRLTKTLVRAIATLWQLVLDFGVQMFMFWLDEQFFHSWTRI